MSWRPKYRQQYQPRSLDRSHQGILDALVEEWKRLDSVDFEIIETLFLTRYVKFPGTSQQREYDLHLLTVSAGDRLKAHHEFWDAEGYLPDNRRLWDGAALTIMPEEAQLTVESPTDQTSPKLGQRLKLIEPDYGAGMRRWLMRRIKAGRDLPTAYDQIEAGEWAKDGKCLDLEELADLDATLRHRQRSALLAGGRKLSMIWGPPGTGKTYTLGSLVSALSIEGFKMLVLAPTNVATDTVALAIDDARNRMDQALEAGELIRPGNPVLHALESRKHLMLWAEKLRKYASKIQSVRKCIKKTQKKLSSGQSMGSRQKLLGKLGRLYAKLGDIICNRSATLWSMARDAKIIVTTVFSGFNKESVRAALARGKWILAVDEASMVSRFWSIPFLSEHPPDQLILAGDIRQLGPIRRSSNHKDKNSIHWVGESLFNLVSAVRNSDVERREAEGSLTLLTQQNRMPPDLCRVISSAFYKSRLKTVGNPRQPPLARGWPHNAVAILDPWRMPLPPMALDQVTDQRTDNGKRCERSAWIAIGLAKRILDAQPNAKTLLLTPFRFQANLLKKLARTHLSWLWEKRIITGTIHVSQGQEADMVIFDPVSPEHVWLMGRIHPKPGSPEAMEDIQRLFCVAFSRAKTQVIVLGKEEEILANPVLSILCQNAPAWAPTWTALDHANPNDTTRF